MGNRVFEDANGSEGQEEGMPRFQTYFFFEADMIPKNTHGGIHCWRSGGLP